MNYFFRLATARSAGIVLRLTNSQALQAVAKQGLIVSMLFLISPVNACPMCKDSAVDTSKPTTSESANLDFNKSIYFMLGGFVTVVGFTGRVMWKATKSS